MTGTLVIPKDTKVWFTSDTHFGHKNIVFGESEWPDKELNTRKFTTTKQMNSYIVDTINKYVKEDDILIHLGDWSFGGITNIWEFRNQIICKNIYLVLGNHDHHIKNNKLLPNTLQRHAQSLFVAVEHYLEVLIDNILFCCMHFPIEEWNDRGNSKIKNSYMIHGHQHGKNRFIPDRLDVGLDSIFNLLGEYRPVNSDEIIQLIKQLKND
jgi:calcineurin-like phosphoesterase family protein